MRKSHKFAIFGAALLLLAAPVAYLYFREISAAIRSSESGSRLIETKSGLIEYGESGEGLPLLSIHGTGGGFDHGLMQARMFGIANNGYRVISPSRYGYLNTPMPDGETTTEIEGDAHADLLDALGIDEPVVAMGVSAGALSAMQLSIRHSERVKALLLIVPAGWVYGPADEDVQDIGENKFILNKVLSSDFLFWSFLKLARGQMLSFVGVSPELHGSLTDVDRRIIDDVVDGMLPVSRRFRGIMKDDGNQHALQPFPIEQIKVPTLIIDARDVGTFTNSTHLAENIDGASLLSFDNGGHLLLGHNAEVQAAVQEFLAGLEEGE
jgi:pimeloyl-ACP methyl ester carboxylesterase